MALPLTRLIAAMRLIERHAGGEQPIWPTRRQVSEWGLVSIAASITTVFGEMVHDQVRRTRSGWRRGTCR
jgi:hypothetical protein